MPAAETQAACLIALLPDFERQVISARQPADQEFTALCRAHHEWGARDRRFFGDVLFGFFRWRGWLKGLPSAAALALAGWLEGFAYPALRRLAEQAKLQLPAATPENLDAKARALSALLGREKNITQLVPDWTLSLLAASAAAPASFLEAFQRRPPVWLRIVPEKIPVALEFFNREQPRARTNLHVPGALAVAPPANFAGLRAATGVAAIVQDLASQCVGLLCAPQPGERWWDVCAGAGGKTLHLAALMQNRGAILATDVRVRALRELGKRAAAAGVTMVQTRKIADGNSAGEFDGALVDAPCSGIGTWNRNPDMRWRTAAADVAAKTATQFELLQRAAQGVRPGGALVYAVCTVTEAETTGVMQDFTRAHPEFRPDSRPHPLTGKKRCGAFWIWPWAGPCDGMFIVRWRRA